METNRWISYVQELRLDHLYDANLLGEGEYLMTMFVCKKRSCE